MYTEITKFFQSKMAKVVFITLGVIIAILLVFKAGEFVGYQKARFSFRWAENYHRNFGGPRGGFFGDFSGDDYPSAHGIFGPIIKIDGSTLIVKGRDGMEKTVLISSDTEIKLQQNKITAGDLKVGDSVTVIGSPNDQGQVAAKLIRVFR